MCSGAKSCSKAQSSHFIGYWDARSRAGRFLDNKRTSPRLSGRLLSKRSTSLRNLEDETASDRIL